MFLNCCPSQPQLAVSQEPFPLTDSARLSSVSQFQEPEIKKHIIQLQISRSGNSSSS